MPAAVVVARAPRQRCVACSRRRAAWWAVTPPPPQTSRRLAWVSRPPFAPERSGSGSSQPPADPRPQAAQGSDSFGRFQHWRRHCQYRLRHPPFPSSESRRASSRGWSWGSQSPGSRHRCSARSSCAASACSSNRCDRPCREYRRGPNAPAHPPPPHWAWTPPRERAWTPSCPCCPSPPRSQSPCLRSPPRPRPRSRSSSAWPRWAESGRSRQRSCEKSASAPCAWPPSRRSIARSFHSRSRPLRPSSFFCRRSRRAHTCHPPARPRATQGPAAPRAAYHWQVWSDALSISCCPFFDEDLASRS
jgi:hypothetical protein